MGDTLTVLLIVDGIFGECLFWVLKLIVGPEYDAVTHMGWVKIFSRVLKVMVPIAVQYEIDNKESMKNRIASRHSAMTTALEQSTHHSSAVDDSSVSASTSQHEDMRMMSIVVG